MNERQQGVMAADLLRLSVWLSVWRFSDNVAVKRKDMTDQML